MPLLEGSILQSYIYSSIDTFIRMGLNADVLLRDSPFELDAIRSEDQDSTALAKISELLLIYENAFNAWPELNLGLTFGKSVGIGIYGIISYAMLSAKSDSDAVQLALKYQPLILGRLATLGLDVEGEWGLIRLDVHTDNSRLHRFYVEQLFASCIVFNQTLAGQKTRIKQLRLAYPDPGYACEYEELFDCSVAFDCPSNEMLFDSGVLDIELPNMNSATTQACRNVCDKLLEKLQQQTSISYRLASLLRSDFLHFPDMAAAAKHFNCDQRTLRRKLLRENTSFRQIKDAVSQQLAIDMLKQGTTVFDVAAKLGYSSPRTFRNAFISWTGIAPTQYRKSEELGVS